MKCSICGDEFQPTGENIRPMEPIDDDGPVCPRCTMIINRVRDEVTRRAREAATAARDAGPLVPDLDDFGID